MGPVHSPAAVTIPLQKHSKQKDNTESNRTDKTKNKQKTSTKNAKGKVIGGPVQISDKRWERGDSIVSTQVLVWQNQITREHRDTKFTLPYQRVSEATQHYAETRDPPSQDPRDHIEQAIKAWQLTNIKHFDASNDNAV